MTALTVIGCVLLFFIFILSLRAKISVIYDGEVRLSVRVLCFNIKILPKKPRKKGPFSMSRKKAMKIREDIRKKQQKKRLKAEQKKKQKEQKKQQKELQKKQEQKKKKLTVSEILDLISMVKDIVATLFKKFFEHLRIDLARVHVNVATGDAATTAIAYGAISEAVFYLFEVLKKVKGFDLPDIEDASITADYLSDATTVDLKISFSLRVWHLFHVLFAVLGKAIKHLVGFLIKRQGRK